MLIRTLYWVLNRIFQVAKHSDNSTDCKLLEANLMVIRTLFMFVIQYSISCHNAYFVAGIYNMCCKLLDF